MVVSPLVATFYCCTKCNWKKEVKSDALELISCPKCGAIVVMMQRKSLKSKLLKLFSTR